MAMKGRHEQFAFTLVPSAVEHENGVGAHHRLEYPVGTPGLQVGGVSGEDLLDGGGLSDKDHRRCGDKADGEGVSVGLRHRIA